MPSGQILLIRHGQSTWNASGRWQGRADPPLSNLGEQQARHAAQAVRAVSGISAITSSHLQRARRTAEILAEGAGLDLLDPIPDFQERHIGPWEGLTRIEIEEQWPGFLDQRRRPDGVETDDEILERVAVGAESLLNSQRGNDAGRGISNDEGGIAVVSHGGVIIAVERAADTPEGPIRNLNGRWFGWHGRTWSPAGERVDLVAGFVETLPDEAGYA